MLLSLTRSLFTNQSSLPRKLILVYSEERNKISEALARRIQRELRAAHLNAHVETDSRVVSAQVPYTVVITRRTLEDGVLDLEYQNPKIREEVHVSNLTERLLHQTGAVALRCTKPANGGAHDDSNATSNTS